MNNIDSDIREILNTYDFNKAMKLINIIHPYIKIYDIIMTVLLYLEQSKEEHRKIVSTSINQLVIEVDYNLKQIKIKIIL